MAIPKLKMGESPEIDFDRLANDLDYRKYILQNIYQRYEKYISKKNIPKGKGEKKMALKTERIMDEKTIDIHRQVFIKIASEQIKGTPEELIVYAKQIEDIFNKW